MKKGVIIGLALGLVANSAFAGDVLWNSITDYAGTKLSQSVSISSVEPLMAITTESTCKIYITDTTGTGLTMAANTFYTIKVPSNISNVVFACTSSASLKTVTVIK